MASTLKNTSDEDVTPCSSRRGPEPPLPTLRRPHHCQKGIIQLVRAIPRSTLTCRSCSAPAPGHARDRREMEEGVAMVAANRPASSGFARWSPGRKWSSPTRTPASSAAPRSTSRSASSSGGDGLRTAVSSSEGGIGGGRARRARSLVDPKLEPGTFAPKDPDVSSAALAGAIDDAAHDRAIVSGSGGGDGNGCCSISLGKLSRVPHLTFTSRSPGKSGSLT